MLRRSQSIFAIVRNSIPKPEVPYAWNIELTYAPL